MTKGHVRNSRGSVSAGRSSAHKTSRKQNKQKGSAGPRIVRARAPVAFAVTATSRHPRFKSGSHGSMVVAHSEFISKVVTSGAGDLEGVERINPGDLKMFPWLANIAERFQRYRFKRLSYRYLPSCPTSTAGSILMTFDPNVNTSDDYTEADLISHVNTQRSQVFMPCTLHVQRLDLNAMGAARTVKSTVASAVVDPYTTFLGKFIWRANDIAAAQTLGEIWVDYEVELIDAASQASSNNGEFFAAEMWNHSGATLTAVDTGVSLPGLSVATAVHSNWLSMPLLDLRYFDDTAYSYPNAYHGYLGDRDFFTMDSDGATVSTGTSHSHIRFPNARQGDVLSVEWHHYYTDASTTAATSATYAVSSYHCTALAGSEINLVQTGLVATTPVGVRPEQIDYHKSFVVEALGVGEYPWITISNAPNIAALTTGSQFTFCRISWYPKPGTGLASRRRACVPQPRALSPIRVEEEKSDEDVLQEWVDSRTTGPSTRLRAVKEIPERFDRLKAPGLVRRASVRG